MRERGLKPRSLFDNYFYDQSLPMRERGLKLVYGSHTKGVDEVAPHAGAWIETQCA